MKSVFAAILLLASSGMAQAQSIISPDGPTVVAPTTAGRSTENLSVTNGSRTSLSVGNSTSFGTSANLSVSQGLTAVSRSVLAPSQVDITSNIGANPLKPGVTQINISNLTAKGGGTINLENQGGIGDGSTINSKDGQFASGDATIDGMGAAVKMSIGSTPSSGTSTGSQASFYSIVHPHVTGECTLSADKACTFKENNGIVSGNAGASANLNTQTNIDIQANSFTTTFAQSF
jgi:hypothetical protein